ncbi:pyrroloquinoline quinone biosynthesis protein PqqF [Pseudomonas sp. KU43P]|uniref:pyrroloquinoline quinone biosynthesis protein PqqF n=1 Tax=Pseudomonas sp. KU43P TaxID=2487887 RepID=UPI0012A9BA0F|nr:pyrroloquinoline quinone biosynthesis protein PqqF [Pseudomonas sp. KU43P]BBH48426.1 coenzyme PQQ synthesis protein F [Pseudomonas sp. KU43P]
MPDATRHLTLANGLQLTLRHAPRLKRSAAALRVHAGSHDAPVKWPGLAHFLEHLFFLGTSRFPLADGLMRYVQALGGQVNASTRERTTDFFFEVPPAALAGGLQRLCQMLAEPDLGIERQRREREVIHAEFIAWSRNPQAQQHYALLQSAPAGHPLNGFHAGNRYTLALQDPAFQHALTGFHHRFYRGGQITLSLCGPQTLDALEQLGRQAAELFAPGDPVHQSPPPTLSAQHSRWLFAHDNLPAGAEQALELLLAYLNDCRPGGWVGALQEHGWLQGFKPQILYAFAGQILWHIDLQLSADANTDQAWALLQGWFGFLRQLDPVQLNVEFGLLQQRRERIASALELARRDSTHQPYAALDSQALHALKSLLEQLPCSEHGQWSLPAVDTLLLDQLPTATGHTMPAAVKISDQLPAARQQAALYLRWHVPSTLRLPLHAALERALRPLQQRCERASLHLQLSAVGEHWQLRCAGHPAAVIRAVEQALTILSAPSAGDWIASTHQPPALIPIRALLERLPNAVLGNQPQPVPASPLAQQMLEDAWQHSRWHGLAAGFDEASCAALATVLQGCPGLAGQVDTAPAWQGPRWHHAQVSGNEHALLLFFPLPAHQQACGRLLAQLLQGAVYQRLRVELQLGYAVFSTFRQIEGMGGLLFGVQSPHVRQDEILDHLRALLHQGVTLEPAARQALAEQFDETAMANDDLAQWLWQTHLAIQTQPLASLRASILKTEQTDLDDLLHAVLDDHATCLCLANAAAPADSWW